MRSFEKKKEIPNLCHGSQVLISHLTCTDSFDAPYDRPSDPVADESGSPNVTQSLDFGLRPSDWNPSLRIVLGFKFILGMRTLQIRMDCLGFESDAPDFTSLDLNSPGRRLRKMQLRLLSLTLKVGMCFWTCFISFRVRLDESRIVQG